MKKIEFTRDRVRITLSLVLMIILVSYAMCAPMGCIGPLMDDISSSLGLSAAGGGLLTTLPVVIFALTSPLTVVIASKIGIAKVISLSLLTILSGVIVRSLGSVFTLFLGTALLGVGTGLLNVAMPSFFKEYYPQRTGKLMGLYSAAITSSSAITAAVVRNVSDAFHSWNTALLTVAVFPLLAFIFSLFFQKRNIRESEDEKKQTPGKLWSLENVFIALYMGLQSLIFYVMITWYPTIIAEKNVTTSSTGILISVMQVASLLPSFLIPVVTVRKNAGLLSSCVPLLFIPGILLAFHTGRYSLVIIGTVIMGLSTGASFSMRMALCSIYGKNSRDTASKISFGQCLGYILAAFGPAGFGYLKDVTGTWIMTVVLLVVLSAVMSISALFLNRIQKGKSASNREG